MEREERDSWSEFVREGREARGIHQGSSDIIGLGEWNEQQAEEKDYCGVVGGGEPAPWQKIMAVLALVVTGAKGAKLDGWIGLDFWSRETLDASLVGFYYLVLNPSISYISVLSVSEIYYIIVRRL
ncbi:hypothetical protein ASPWEDRAFT_69016 [Aspergillus wentii DTO 134E9]|uniref:Uncharacterized protein n=1 Tax=Aspergillus wentii DTO 134E9 TaxID=1073089 RepID=A0A1L9RL93_ASPWE|nr:uncharacterized protein ASPWEDRAFT_69016 [Aspergillus wentii DTO 134E9]OJJ35709.1 hypothetical protein ASPWEDRAFT_69016 [Aspergillus wentii DTO 134E9]